MAFLYQLARFGAVGVTALIVHWLSVVTIVPLGVPPLIANVIAFLIAFQVSYWGHRNWTFNVRHLPHRATLPRFILIGCAGFAVNESLYFLLLTYTKMDYRLSLLIVLTGVVTTSFVLSKLWAFR